MCDLINFTLSRTGFHDSTNKRDCEMFLTRLRTATEFPKSGPRLNMVDIELRSKTIQNTTRKRTSNKNAIRSNKTAT